MFKLNKVNKQYTDNKSEYITALDDVTLSFDNSGLVVIRGTSGCGKTTLLNILGGLDKPTSGSVYFDGEKIDDRKENWWDAFRSEHLGFVYQDFNLLENMTVLENIQLPLEMLKLDEVESKRRIDELTEELGITEYLSKKASKLSGGQKQRVAIARAIVSGAKILLADEPTGNLDRENSENVFALLKKIAKNRLVIVVTHDDMLANKYADRLIKISYGKIESDVQINQNEKVADESEDSEVSNYSKRKKLPLKVSIQFVKEAISLRKTRCLVSVLIFSITMIFAMLLSEMIFREDSIPLIEYMKSRKQQMIPVYMSIPEENYDAYAYEKVMKGRKFYEHLISTIDESRIIRQDSTRILKYGEKDCNCNIFFASDANEKYFSYEGKYPKEKNEVAISYEVAEKLGLTENILGATVEMELKKYVVTAVITKVCEKDASEIYANDEFDDKTNVLDDIVVFSLATFEDIGYSTHIEIPGYGVIYENSFLSQTTIYDNVDTINKDITLLAGSLPVNDNEVVIKKGALDMMQESYESVIGKEYKLSDLYEKEYGCTYWGLLNLYEFVGGSVKVVGVVEQKGMDEGLGKYFVSSSLYEKLYNEQNMYFTYDYYFILDEEFIEEDIYNMNNNDIKLQISELDKVYEFIDTIDSLKITLLVVCLVIAGLCVLQMISLYSYSIEDNKKTIGILRTMGVYKSDTLKIFTMECIVVSTISFVVAVLIGILLTNVLNELISYNIFQFEGLLFLRMRPVILVAVGLINFVLSALSVIIPIKKCQKIKIIQLLK